MKKSIFIFTILILLPIFNGCGNFFEQHVKEIVNTSEIKINETEAPEIIINNGNGNCAIQSDRIYFINGYDGGTLYSMKIDGSDICKINDDRLERFYLSDGQIIYVNNSDGGKLYAIDINGDQKYKLSDDKIVSVFWNVSNGWVYYDNWDERKLYKIRTNGSERTRLNYDTLYMNVADDRIYYYDDTLRNGDVNGIYSIKTDGSDKIKLSGDSIYRMSIADGWIYFNNTNDDYKLYAMRTDGGDRHKFCDDYALEINVVGDRIYYVSGHEGKICGIKTDGSDKKNLSDDHAQWLIVSDNKIYYTIIGANIYSMNIDGSDKRLIADLDKDVYKDATYEICASLHESMPEYRFVAKGTMWKTDNDELGTGEVMGLEGYNENGLSILSADFSENFYDTISGYPAYNEMMDTMGLHITDVNFDGYKDVIILNCFAGAHGNSWYDCWLWDAETSSFVVSASFAQICNPALDLENQCIYSAGGSGAAYWGGSIYKFINGEFVVTNDLDTDWGGLVETELVDGKMVIVREVSFLNDKGEYIKNIVDEEMKYYRNSELWQLDHPHWYWVGGHQADEWLE